MRALLAALALLPASALASGYYYSDSGIVATGRGGAWIAGGTPNSPSSTILQV